MSLAERERLPSSLLALWLSSWCSCRVPSHRDAWEEPVRLLRGRPKEGRKIYQLAACVSGGGRGGGGEVHGVTNLAFLALFLKASNGGSKRLHISHHNLVLLQKSLQQRGKWKITRRRTSSASEWSVGSSAHLCTVLVLPIVPAPHGQLFLFHPGLHLLCITIVLLCL